MSMKVLWHHAGRGMAKSRTGAEEGIVSKVGEDPGDDGRVMPGLCRNLEKSLDGGARQCFIKGLGSRVCE